MKFLNKLFLFCLLMLTAFYFVQSALAQTTKTLSLSRDAIVSNTGDETARTATLDVILKGGADDVNGLVFTLFYDKDVFTFEGVVKGDMDIDDGSTYDPENPPSTETIASTLYYQYNNKPSEGIVMFAAAAANFFTTTASADFVPFKVKFKVNAGIGNGKYPIGIQKTIIGPDTAKNAGYDEPTELDAAAGLDPDEDPTTAQSYEVGMTSGLITVSGGYKVSGTAVFGSISEQDADSIVVSLIQVMDFGSFEVSRTVVENGAYSFTSVPTGTYKVEAFATKPGFQKHFISTEFTVDGQDTTAPAITLSKYKAKSGKITINDENPSGLRIEIRDKDGNVIGTAAVDSEGGYVTQPLPDPLPDGYKIVAVYGTSETDITGNPDYDWVLSLGSISGTITGLCDDQRVEVYTRSESTKLQKSLIVTGQAGSNTYKLPNLLPGTDYILSVVGEGVGPVYYDGAEDFSSAASVEVTAGSDTGSRDFVFTCTDLITISGKITVDGSPVENATVKANNFNFTNWKFGSDQTDADGNFEIKVAEANDYYVYFKHDGKTFYYKDNSGTAEAVTQRADATLVDVTGGSITGKNIPVVIEIPDTAGLEGYVTLNRSKDNGGIRLEDYLVGLFTSDNVPLPFVSRTDKNGYYLFENMAPGTYNIVLLPPYPYARQVKEGVALVNNQTATVDFIVDQNYEITGLVKDASDQTSPVAGARVDIVKIDGRKLRSATYTDSKGEYTLVEIPSGVYTLIASHKDYFSESQEASVSSDVTADDILMTKGGIIQGTVSDDNGVVNRAVVTLRGFNYTKSTRTDKNGEYQFRGLEVPDKPHIIKAAKGTEYKPFAPEDVSTTNAGETVTHNLSLEKPATTWSFQGKVTEGGSPVANAYTLLFSKQTKYQKVVKTNASGDFSFSHVMDGDGYWLLVLPGNGKPEVIKNIGAINADVAAYTVEVPSFTTLSGKITLSEADASAIVIAGAYDPLTGLLHEAGTQNPEKDNKTFTFEIKVKAGVSYKVFAQDLTLTFPLKYYIDGSTSGSYGNSKAVTGTKTDVDIALTK